jgi:hypothetical protein
LFASTKRADSWIVDDCGCWIRLLLRPTIEQLLLLHTEKREIDCRLLFAVTIYDYSGGAARQQQNSTVLADRVLDGGITDKHIPNMPYIEKTAEPRAISNRRHCIVVLLLLTV